MAGPGIQEQALLFRVVPPPGLGCINNSAVGRLEANPKTKTHKDRKTEQELRVGGGQGRQGTAVPRNTRHTHTHTLFALCLFL